MKDKENSKFTKNTNGKNVTFTFTQTEKDKDLQSVKVDVKTTISATFNGGKMVEYTNKTEISNEDGKSTTIHTVKNSGKVEAPKDASKYVDMTDYGVIVTDLTNAKEGNDFSNNSDIEVKHLGNRIYWNSKTSWRRRR